MSEPTTPLMRQYAAVKKEHPNALLFFRLGDFYEMFFEDAVVAAKELQITLTSRNKEKGAAIPMCGVPYHAAEGYIAKLIRKGFKVAICEQMEDPRMTKTLVKREVTRVVTPGTAADSQLGAEENNFLACVAQQGEVLGLAVLDLSTGEFRATEFRGDDAARRVREELQVLRPREVLFASSLPLFDDARQQAGSSRIKGSLRQAQGRPFDSALPPSRDRFAQDDNGKANGSFDSGGQRHAASAQDDNLKGFRAAQAVSAAMPRMANVENAMWAETPLEDWVFAPDYAIPLVENHFGVLSLEGFGLAGRAAAASAAGAILHYVRSTQRGALSHVDRIGYYERQNCLVLDAVTIRNLELLEPLFSGGGDSLTVFRSLDCSVTPMGKRLLRAWLLRPSIERGEIEWRLDAVEAMVRGLVAREELRRAMDGILDLERLLSRVTLEAANPRDLLALGASLARLPGVRAALARFDAARLRELHGECDELADLRERIAATVEDEPPLTLADGGVIRAGVDAALDELRDLSRNSKQYIAQIEQRERQRTGIASLKVKFNNVFGYYLEISKANLQHAPADYERKQTLVNAERFTTPELKEYEAKVLDAQEKIVEIERRLFAELRAAIAAEARRIRQTALALAEIDVLAGFATQAANRGYCRPRLDDSNDIEIVDGRHPVIEQQDLSGVADRFVPNDLYLNGTTHAVLVITGPNMGGKSTYLRQAALIVLMAQMGSYVPARSARLGMVDRIFTRIGASDNLARGRSTFMVEMTETAAILNTATPRSLILLDEVGRGTSTYDGLAIAWAAIEYIHANTRAKTLFATHYHELTELADRLSGVKNFHVTVKESGGGIVFLRKVVEGAADKSYGIEVAKLAGLPADVIHRAREVLAEHESAEKSAVTHLARSEAEDSGHIQLTMFTPLSQKIVDRIKETDLNGISPLEALNLLHELKRQME